MNPTSNHATQIRHHRDWQALANEWIHLLQSASSVHEILHQLVNALPWRVVGFFKVLENENKIVAQASKGYGEWSLEPLEFRLSIEDNIISRCYAEKRTITLLNDDDWKKQSVALTTAAITKQLQIDMVAIIPLIHGGQVMGVISISDSRGADLSQRAVRAVEAIAPIVASMISKQELLEKIDRENQALRWMQEMSQVLLFVRSEEELWREFRDMLIQIGQVSGGTYVVRKNEGWRVHDVFGILAPYRHQVAKDMPAWIDARFADDWTRDRIRWTLPGARILPPYIEVENENARGLRYYVGDEQQVYAVTTLYFVSSDPLIERIIPALLQMFTLAFQVIRQRRTLEYYGVHDPLTGLWNRRALETHMEHYFKNPLASSALLVLCDLDGFKQLNDTFGHQRGDEALQAIAHYFTSALSPVDFVSRLGGDEFVLVLHNCAWHDEAVRRLRDLNHRSPLAGYHLTITMGIVELPGECRDITEAYRLADERLYHGKRAGKNQVVGPTGKVIFDA